MLILPGNAFNPGERPGMTTGDTLVTGSTGFVGRHVQRLWPGVVNWSWDLTQPSLVESKVQELMNSTPFDKVLHLAGRSSPRESLEDPARAFNTNLMGTVHLLTALERAQWKGRFLLVSSCAVYGDQSGCLTEDTPLRPANPYAVSKVAAEFACLEWGRRTANAVMVARPFNHSGPGRSREYFLASMAAQIAALPPEGGVLKVGNLEVHRDFLHVEDVVEAYRLLLERGRGQEIYHISHGHSRRLQEYVDALAAESGKEVRCEVTRERYREDVTEPMEISVEKLRQDTGWQPTRSLQQLARELIAAWTTQKA